MQLVQEARLETTRRAGRTDHDVRFIVFYAVAAVVILMLMYRASDSPSDSADTIAAMAVFP